MCTTFLAYNIARALVANGDGKKTTFIDYPNLIRHNPNIPWKTRGNASLVLRVKSEFSAEELFAFCAKFLRKYSTSERANSGLVLFEGAKVPQDVIEFSRRSLCSVLSVKEAESIIKAHGMRMLGLRSRQGLVGALAGIGNTLESDYTFELIAYRRSLSIPRRIDSDRILEMDEKSPLTFSNVDRKHGRVMIMPHGPDPVLCGIRGETASCVREAFQSLLPIKNLRGWMILRSNQGTGEHLSEEINLASPKAYSSGWVKATVASIPKIERGGHVFFNVQNGNGGIVCACYEPTREFRNVALALLPGDELKLGGGVRKSTRKHEKVLNVETLMLLGASNKFLLENPGCKSCGRRMSSPGRGQGYVCRCGARSPNAKKRRVAIKRYLKVRELYLPPVCAHRHLTKPSQRYLIQRKGKFRTSEMLRVWLS